MAKKASATGTGKIVSYRHSRTGAVRKTKGILGYPYVAMTDAEADEAADQTTATEGEGAQGPSK